MGLQLQTVPLSRKSQLQRQLPKYQTLALQRRLQELQ